MKRYIIPSLICVCIIISLSFDKSKFDLINNSKSNKRGSGSAESGKLLTNAYSEVSLMKGGYFTIGTTMGVSDAPLDNYCQVTFGHPAALTSFPIFSVDGNWMNSENFFSNALQEISSNNDTLKLKVTEISGFNAEFSLVLKAQKIQLLLTILNNDINNHKVGLGFLFDPALGRNGDGYLNVDNKLINCDTSFFQDTPNSITIWEKRDFNKGLGIQLNFPGDVPSAIEVNNWENLFLNKINELHKLFDLALRMKGEETNLRPGEKKSYMVEVELVPPDFKYSPFIRWDLPTALSIENNLLFPVDLPTNVEVVNSSDQSKGNLSLEVEGSAIEYQWETDKNFSLSAKNFSTFKVPVTFQDVYEIQIVPMTLILKQNNIVIDKIERNVFIPASPFSNNGLSVDIDSVISLKFPQIQLKFNSKIESNGQLLYDIKKSNIFLYEDGKRINDFNIDKDTSGGVNQADIVFILDVTGSMSDEIDGVKNNIIEFGSSLKKNGVDYRIAMVTFLDIIENVFDFTSDPAKFKSVVEQQYAHEGGDEPENSLEALKKGVELNFRKSANKIFIWITDATYHQRNQNTNLSKEDVINLLLSKGITVDCIGPKSNQTEYYDQIVMNTGGNFYDIYGNFRDILLDISRLRSSGKYLLKYTSTAINNLNHDIELEIHYAGLGGVGKTSYNSIKKSGEITSIPKIESFPNPFKSATLLTVYPQKYGGNIEIFNLAGQKLREFKFNDGLTKVDFQWNSTENARQLNPGIYLAVLTLYDNTGQNINKQTFKLIKMN